MEITNQFLKYFTNNSITGHTARNPHDTEEKRTWVDLSGFILNPFTYTSCVTGFSEPVHLQHEVFRLDYLPIPF